MTELSLNGAGFGDSQRTDRHYPDGQSEQPRRRGGPIASQSTLESDLYSHAAPSMQREAARAQRERTSRSLTDWPALSGSLPLGL